MKFEITPIPKPRMVKSDAWKQRKIVLDYWEYKDKLKSIALENDYKISSVLENITFIIPIPKSWSKKKQMLFIDQPHKQKPDLDNLIKAFQDCLCENDSFIHTYNNIKKVWGLHGAIIIKNKEF